MKIKKRTDTLCTVTVKQEVSRKRIGDLLCSAFEGGSNYWYMIEEFIAPPKPITVFWDEPYGDAKPQLYRHVDFPLTEGGALIVSDAKEATGDDVRRERLDLATITRGLQVMAEKYPRHFGDFMAENDDATTADVFLQCCLFQELVYG